MTVTRSRRSSHEMRAAVVGAGIGAAATIAAALIAHSTGIVYIGTGPQATGTVVTPGPTVTVPGPTVTANPSGGVAPSLPDGVTVRRSTGTSPVHLRNGYSVDLDDNTSPNWSVNANSAGDVGWAGVDTLYFDSDYAQEKGAVGYSTCAKETGYQNNQPAIGDLQNGEEICIRTSGNRYAVVKILSATANELDFTVTVWDPPFTS